MKGRMKTKAGVAKVRIKSVPIKLERQVRKEIKLSGTISSMLDISDENLFKTRPWLFKLYKKVQRYVWRNSYSLRI